MKVCFGAKIYLLALCQSSVSLLWRQDISLSAVPVHRLRLLAAVPVHWLPLLAAAEGWFTQQHLHVITAGRWLTEYCYIQDP